MDIYEPCIRGSTTINKNKEILIIVTILMKLENITQSERKQSQEITYYMIPFTLSTQDRQTHRKSKFVVAYGIVLGNGEGMIMDMVFLWWSLKCFKFKLWWWLYNPEFTKKYNYIIYFKRHIKFVLIKVFRVNSKNIFKNKVNTVFLTNQIGKLSRGERITRR